MTTTIFWVDSAEAYGEEYFLMSILRKPESRSWCDPSCWEERGCLTHKTTKALLSAHLLPVYWNDLLITSTF